MKNILVATDFSNNAYNALFFATQLFKDRKCTFHLLNTYTELTQLISQKVGMEGRRSLMAQLADESREGLNEVYHRIHLDQNNPKHQFKVISRNKYFIEAVTRIIDSAQIDLLVMGNKGITGAKNTFWGSNVTKAINEISSCPILTVPKEIEIDIPKEIAFATDYRHNYNAKVLHPFLYLTSLCQAKVCILHINEEQRLDEIQKSNLYTLREYLGDIQHSIHWMPDFASKSEVIQTFLDELNIDMLTMIKYDHGFISKMIREPVIKKVNFDLEIPFLILPYVS